MAIRTGTILDSIVAAKLKEVAQTKKASPLEQLHSSCEARLRGNDFRSFRSAITLRGDGKLRLITELKMRSPSAKDLMRGRDPIQLAQTYEQCGAAAISIVTDAEFFGGSLQMIQQVRQKTQIPLLRKEFIIDEYQIYESCAAGADAILLIAAICDTDTLSRFIELSSILGMDCLVEIHSKEEVLSLPNTVTVVGINNRDLKSFIVNIATTQSLIPLIQKRHEATPPIIVSESGISSRAHLTSLHNSGAHAALIGTSLLTASDVREKLKELTS